MPPDSFNQEALQQAHVDIAVLKTEMAHLRKEVDELRSALSDLTVAVSALTSTLSEARGGWKMMMLLGGGAATLGSALTWFMQHITLKGHP